MKSTKGSRVAACIIAAGMLATINAGAASAKTVYQERAHATSYKAKWGCVFTRYTALRSGVACFEPYGDRIYIRDLFADGYHLEFRGEVNQSGNPGIRCYTYASAADGWQVCDGLASRIAEHRTIAGQLMLYNGSRVMAVSPEMVYWSTT